MRSERNVDQLIREALQVEDIEGFDQLGEPGLPDMVTEVFRGRLWWAGALFMFMILVMFILSIVCAVRFLGADEVPDMLRWGAGFFLCVVAVIGGKIWYWMQLQQLAVLREVKRVELLVAHLSEQLRSGA
jgi:uncharacterized membrane protein (DUF485 family)